MKCREAIDQLSPLLDDLLDGDRATGILQHLGACPACRSEWERLVGLREKLSSLGRIQPPQYLRHMVQLRLDAAARAGWRNRLRDALSNGWSRIRTTEGIWYLTRLAGAAMTCLFFLAISTAMTPVYFRVKGAQPGRDSLSPEARHQLVVGVLKNLGLRPVEAQRRPIGKKDPQIHDLYLLNFSQNVSRKTADDSFSVVTVIDRRGSVRIQNILEYPADETLLEDFNAMLVSARCRPASEDGRAVDAHLVMNFSKIAVYE